MSNKSCPDNSSTHWEMRESIEITLTAQPEDTLMVTGAEERLDMIEVIIWLVVCGTIW